MGLLFQELQRLIARDQYVIGLHAAERLEERGIMQWQVVSGVPDGQLILERSSAQPNPVVEMRELLPDGIEIKAV